jgi:hypothetical protein
MVAVKPVLAKASDTKPAKNQQAALFLVRVFSLVITSLLFWLSREMTAPNARLNRHGLFNNIVLQYNMYTKEHKSRNLVVLAGDIGELRCISRICSDLWGAQKCNYIIRIYGGGPLSCGILAALQFCIIIVHVL